MASLIRLSISLDPFDSTSIPTHTRNRTITSISKSHLRPLKPDSNSITTSLRSLTKTQDWKTAEKLVRQMILSPDPSQPLTPHVFNTLIYASSKRGLLKLSSKWFRMMLDCSVPPDITTFGILMRHYQKCCDMKEAEFAMATMRRFGVVCESAYSSMVTIYTRLGFYEKAESVIELMRVEVRVLNVENWLVVLNCYCQQGKMVEAEKVFEEMREEAEYAMSNVVAYNTMITGFGKGSNMDGAERVFNSLSVRGVEPDETSYRSMVEGWGRAGNYEKARWYYEETKRLGYKANSSNLFTMVKLCANEGDLDGAVGVLDDMVKCGCHYSSIIGTLVSVYERAGKVYELPGLLKGSFYRYVLVNQSCCSTVVMAYVKNKMVDDVLRVLRDKKWKDLKYEYSLYHLLICSCKEEGLLEDAVKIYKQMQKSDDDNDKKKLNKHVICTMIDVYSMMGNLKDAEMLYLKLKNSSSSNSLDMIAVSIVVKMYFRAGSLKEACSVLDDIDKRPDIVPDMVLLRYMLRIYQRCNMVDKLEQLYSKISKDRLNWDQEFYNCVVNCCAQALPVDELSRLFDEMLQRGFMPNTVTYNVVLNAFGKAKLFKKVKKVYLMAKKQGLVDVITYNTIIASYGKDRDFTNMSRTVWNMQFDGFSVSLEAYNSMLDAYGKDGQIDAFRSVLQKMKESNCASDLYTYNTVINIYGQQGWIEEVADVLAELNKCGLRPDLYSYNTFIKACGIAGMVQEAVNVIKEMRKNGIEPDVKTYTNLVNALKRNDEYLEAVKWSLWMKQLQL
ncbi:pentatricopeptide repeat-containing protein At4g30825, chloroplastic [Vicia villosa]|uniref:pentatricopeptide repeat-containing protein At4g30825, chloroplastic n=1 Tax=Vicia villosa TaxID=3911 RepID=UPI00273B673F|nr:pentatricopeptide repeat-containing protein At4g30825, chloroplastic [Vicia villosa]